MSGAVLLDQPDQGARGCIEHAAPAGPIAHRHVDHPGRPLVVDGAVGHQLAHHPVRQGHPTTPRVGHDPDLVPETHRALEPRGDQVDVLDLEQRQVSLIADLQDARGQGLLRSRHGDGQPLLRHGLEEVTGGDDPRPAGAALPRDDDARRRPAGTALTLAPELDRRGHDLTEHLVARRPARRRAAGEDEGQHRRDGEQLADGRRRDDSGDHGPIIPRRPARDARPRRADRSLEAHHER